MDSHRNSSLPSWTHEFGGENFDPSRHERNIDGGTLDLACANACNQDRAGFDDLVTSRLSRVLCFAISSAFRDQHHLEDSCLISRNICSLEELSDQRTDCVDEQTQVLLSDYQLGMWLYNTVNSEITFAERMEKSNWEVYCLSRL